MPYELTFDSNLLVPYDEMLPGRMSEAEIANLDRDSPLHVVLTAPPATEEELERMTTDPFFETQQFNFRTGILLPPECLVQAPPFMGPLSQ